MSHQFKDVNVSRYEKNKDGYFVRQSSTFLICPFPDVVVTRQPFVNECQHLVRSPEQCLFSIDSEFISSMYVGALDMPYIRWGYTDGYALIFKKLEENFDIISFENSANVAHSIYYDYLNGRFTDSVNQLEKSLLLLNSNM